MGNKTIAVDFDGVIHAYSKGWHDGSCYDEPIEGAIEHLESLMEKYNVFILSTRNPEDIIAWLKGKAPGIKAAMIPRGTTFWNTKGVLGVTREKLAANVYIDDRGYRFVDWPYAKKWLDLWLG